MAYSTRHASPGSISSGTRRTEDLLSAFASELDYQLGRQAHRFPRASYRKMIREAESLIRRDDCDSAAESCLVDELQDVLGEFAPAYGYFGTHEGDGADFGFWVSDPRECGFDGLVIDAGDELPKGYRGEVLVVNDHGNMSLYVANGRGKTREIWSVF